MQFGALNVSCTLVCLTPQSPCAQTSDATLSPVEYVPDRAMSPTVIMPEVRVKDRDGVFPSGAANQFLSKDTMKWYVNGKEISTVWKAYADGVGDYEIIKTDDDTRGCLRIYKNIEVGTDCVLTFKATFNDYRTNVNYLVESDSMALTTVDKGADAVTLTVDKINIVYDPVYDPLLLCDYRNANGIATGTERSANRTDKAFEQDVTVNVVSGQKTWTALPKGYTMQVVSLKDNAKVTPASVEHPEVLKVAFPVVTLDMRMIDVAEYDVQILDGNGTVVTSTSFSARTDCSLPSFAAPINAADVNPKQDMYYNSALLSLPNTAVADYPELYYMIQWYTQARTLSGSTWVNATPKAWQRGASMSTAVKDIGIGTTYESAYFVCYFDAEEQAVCTLTADEDGNVLVDESGNFLID